MDTGESTPLLSGSQADASVTEKDRRSVWRDGCRCWPKRYTTEVAVFLYAVYMAAAIPLVDQFVYARVAREKNYTAEVAGNCSTQNDTSPESRLRDEVQAEATTVMIYQKLAEHIPSFFTTVLLGNLSDRVGRKVAMLCPCVGAVLHCLLCAAVVGLELPFVWLYVATAIQGLFGGFILMTTACYAHVSDLTTTQNRSFRIVLMETVLGVGKASAKLALGYLIRSLGYMWPFLIVMPFALLDVIYIIFCVPETVASRRSETIFSRKHLLLTFNLYLKDNGTGRRWKLWLTMLIIFLHVMPLMGSSDVTTYHVLDSPLCWDSVLIGQYGSYSFIVSRLGALLAVVLFGRYLKDIGLIILGTLFGVTNYIMFAFARTTTAVFLVPLVGLFIDVPDKIAKSINSKIVAKDELGAMYASLAWINLAASLCASVTFNAVYRATLSWMPTFVFLLMAGFNLVALFIALIFLLKTKFASRKEAESVHDGQESAHS